MARKILFSEPMRDNDDCAFLRIVEAGHDLAVERVSDPLELPDVVAIFDSRRIVDDDQVRTLAGHAAFDRDGTHPAAGSGDEVMDLAAILRNFRLEEPTEPLAFQDLPN